MCSCGYLSRLMLHESFAEIDRRTDIQITVAASQHIGVKHQWKLKYGARYRVRTCDFLRVKQALYH